MGNAMKRALYITLALLVCLPAFAQESRRFSEIQQADVLPENAVRLNEVQPISRELIETSVQRIAEQWNTANLEEVLADEFYDAQRLEDTLLSSAPRDAKLRVLSIQGQQVLQQYMLEGSRYSRVSVTVRTQAEFEDPQNGFQRREGTAEWILKIVETPNEEAQ